jgi:hypothetical protein
VSWIKMTFALLAAAALVVLLAGWIGSLRLAHSSAQLTSTLVHAANRTGSARVNLAALEELPAPVVRYLKHVLREGQPHIRVAHLRQVGTLRTDTRSTRWLPFEARQVVVPSSPGFIWDARVSILPLLHVRVRDAYVRGTGSGRVSLLSALTVAADSGRHELNAGALHRYLAEAVWYPTALLPSAALKWSPIDGLQALATLTDSGISVSLQFQFNGNGEVTGIYSPGRWGKFGDQYRQRPWEGHFRNYQEQDGMLVPSEGEVGWYSAGGWERIWEGNITEAGYEFAE